MDTQIDRTTRSAPRMTWVPVNDGRGRVHMEARWLSTPRLGMDPRAA